ncbi:unnamed protein product [Zymoseptoria tritici ST99CH_1A5]|uniref:GED domain-containing protein n=1 Tax=Zymoseptoria tritici ST99CH_1A5 TaxID=1276529 RepID=A0A1Y6LY24_ZYMTR|nr:unnamed protein product [Zymoseptoria tritici ST99CH_1A5]
MPPKAKLPKKAQPIASNASLLNSASLNGLHNTDCRTMLKLVDALQACRLGTMLALPQLVVCGDQSSGKSSVLEAITEVPFPRKENLCTRFATEIIMRTDETPSIRARIIPDGQLPTKEHDRLTLFNRTITDFDEFEQLIDDATDHMGLPPVAQDGKKAKVIKAFSRNVLSIEISGPDRLPLTLVDLPGLIHTKTAVQTDEDKKLIHRLVDDYLKEERTIVLAVAAASSDIANMMIFDKCSKVDPAGARTLGIITKMDRLPAKSTAEADWLKNARNENIDLQLGWYLLKNRSDEEAAISFDERNKSETEFFDQGSYKAFPKSNKGIESLRTRIAELVFEEGKRRLPKIREDAQKKLEEVIKDLKLLGDERSNVFEQRRLLMKISVDFENIVTRASEEHYEHDFFRIIDKDAVTRDAKQLCATKSKLQRDFDSQMVKYGHKNVFPQAKEASAINDLQDDASIEKWDIKLKQDTLSSKQAVRWVSELHAKTQGREMPGNFNSSLVSHLFHEQSMNWGVIAEAHILKIDHICTALVVAVISHVAPLRLANSLFDRRFNAILDRRYHDAHAELKRLLEDRKAPVSIHDQSFAADVKARDQRRHQAQLDEAIRNGYSAIPITAPIKQDTATIMASKALDQLVVVYEHQRRTFINNVTQQVIERHLLHGLAEEIFTPTIVSEMSDEEISKLAKEPDEVAKQRAELKEQKSILEDSRKAFLKVLNPSISIEDGVIGEGEGRDEGPKRLRRSFMG